MGKARMHLTARLNEAQATGTPARAPDLVFCKSVRKEFTKKCQKRKPGSSKLPRSEQQASFTKLVPPEHCRHPHLVCVLQKVTEALPLSVQ